MKTSMFKKERDLLLLKVSSKTSNLGCFSILNNLVNLINFKCDQVKYITKNSAQNMNKCSLDKCRAIIKNK